MNNLNIDDLNVNISINKLILVNSASYRLLETKLDNNLYITGSNNAGKTSVLNLLQFLFLPEENLKNIKNKFEISSKKSDDNHSYTEKETYNYYFDTKSSFIIYEITNKSNTFLVILYGKNKTNLQYNRFIVNTTYNNIRDIIVNLDENNNIIPTEIEIQDLISKIKKEDIECIELKNKKEIKETLFTVKKNYKRTPYNIVPLVDTSEKTLNQFKLLFKNFFNINKMDLKNKINIIAELVTNNLKKEQKELVKFDLEKSRSEYEDIIQREKKINILEENSDNYDIIMDFEENNKSIINELKDNILYLYHSIEKNKLEIAPIRKEIGNKSNMIKDQVNENNKYIKTLQNEIISFDRELNDLKKELKRRNNEFLLLQEFLDTQKSSKEIQNDYNLSEIQISINDKNSKLLSEKEILEKEIQNLNEQAQINKIYQKIKNDISNLKYSLNKKEQVKNNYEKIFISNLTENEKIVYNTVFSKDMINIYNITANNQQKIKEFLNLFQIDGDFIIIDDEKIEKKEYQFNLEELEIDIENDILSLEKKEIEKKEIEIILNNNNLEIEKYRKDKLFKIKNIKLELHKLNKITTYIDDLEKIDIVLNSNPETIIMKEEEIKDMKNNINSSELDNKSLMEELEENNGKYSELKKEQEELEEVGNLLISNININDYLFEDGIENEYFNKKLLIDKIITYKSTYNGYNNELDIYIKRKNEIIKLINKFINYKIFDYLDDDIINNFTDKEEYYLIIIKKLKEEYNSLFNLQTELEESKKLLQESTSAAIDLLKTMVSEIKKEERKINKEFSLIKISNLKQIKFHFELEKHLQEVLEEFEKSVETKLDNYDILLKKINEHLRNLNINNNIINIGDLISKISYTIIDQDDYASSKQQSNGTETMINMIFLNLLINRYYEEDYNLQLPLVLDEVSNIDTKNMESIMEEIKKFKCILAVATPHITPSITNLFEYHISVNRPTKTTVNGRNYVVPFEMSPILKDIK